MFFRCVSVLKDAFIPAPEAWDFFRSLRSRPGHSGRLRSGDSCSLRVPPPPRATITQGMHLPGSLLHLIKAHIRRGMAAVSPGHNRCRNDEGLPRMSAPENPSPLRRQPRYQANLQSASIWTAPWISRQLYVENASLAQSRPSLSGTARRSDDQRFFFRLLPGNAGAPFSKRTGCAGSTWGFLQTPGEGMGRGDRDIAGGPRLRRASPWGTPWPVPAEPLRVQRGKGFESCGHLSGERSARRGWNREGADSPAGKPEAKTGPGAQERFPCPLRSPETFPFHLHLHLHIYFHLHMSLPTAPPRSGRRRAGGWQRAPRQCGPGSPRAPAGGFPNP